MALETGDYIDDLNQNNPVGATDTVATLDDHIRLVKKVLLQSFPNITGAVNLTQGQLGDGARKSEAADISGAWDFNNDPTIDDVEIGAKRSVITVDDDAHAFVLTESGETIQKDAGVAATWTIPANASVAFPTGTIIQGRNRDAQDITLAITTDTLRLIPAGTTGSITVSQYGQFTIQKVTTTEWWCTGVNIA